MRRNLLWIAITFGLVLLGVAVIEQPKTCFACSSDPVNPPPTCSASMSAMTVRKADERKAWWPWSMLDQREERTLKVYLGLNRNSGITPVSYEYTITANGDWQPSTITPITGTGTLGFPGGANETLEVTIPYSLTDQGTLNLTATVSSSSCVFTPNTVTSSVQLNKQGPTVWPITSRSCPLAGEKPTFKFGVRNPSDQPQIYSVTARANPQFGGDHTPNLGGDGTTSGQPGLHQFPDMTLKSGEAKEIQITCETFGFCLTGSESRVQLEVNPAAGSAEQFTPAVAASSVTIRAPESVCPALEDWWFIMAPLVLLTLVGLPTALALLGGTAWFVLHSGSATPPPPDGGGSTSDSPTIPKTGKGVDKGTPQGLSGSEGVRK